MFDNVQNLTKIPLTILGNQLRAACWIKLAKHGVAVSHPCILDTGADLTVIPHRIWRPYENAIEFITGDPDANKPIRGVGGTVPAQRAWVGLGVSSIKKDAFPIWWPRAKVVLAHDHLDPKQGGISAILLGMGGGVHDTGGFCVNWLAKDAHLVKIG